MDYVHSKVLKAKLRATKAELLTDFSLLLDSRLTNLTLLESHQHSELVPRKRRIKQRQPQFQDIEGILGFASFLSEVSAMLPTTQKEQVALLQPSTYQSAAASDDKCKGRQYSEAQSTILRRLKLSSMEESVVALYLRVFQKFKALTKTAQSRSLL